MKSLCEETSCLWRGRTSPPLHTAVWCFFVCLFLLLSIFRLFDVSLSVYLSTSPMTCALAGQEDRDPEWVGFGELLESSSLFAQTLRNTNTDGKCFPIDLSLLSTCYMGSISPSFIVNVWRR